MKFEHTYYEGHGINHDQDDFKGSFIVQQLPHLPTYTIKFVATRLKDDVKVHEELGMLTVNENDEFQFHLHMEELLCATLHTVKENLDSKWIFEYQGTGKIEGFSSELVFEFTDDGFKYTHRWAMGGEVSDKSWCLFSPKK